MQEIRRVAVIGAGTMGHGIAQSFAMSNISVRLVDETDNLLGRGQSWIIDNLDYMVELGGINREKVKSTLEHIQFTTDLKQASQEADYVIEAVFENLALKQRLFHQLDGYTQPHTILASNTSSFGIEEFSAGTNHPERIIGTHWFHPPYLTPAVEVIPSKETSQKTIDRTIDLLTRIGKAPTICKSAPGFVANRIQLAMVAEALAIVEEGLATPDEVDRIVRTSFGFRLSAYGPFQICDQAGLDVYRSVYDYLYGKLKREHFKPNKALIKLVDEGRLGLKTRHGFYEYQEGKVDEIKRERDRKLFARLRLFREEQKREKKRKG